MYYSPTQNNRFSIGLIILLLTTLGCGGILPETAPSAVLAPTRTPLPTFTATAENVSQLPVVVPPTATPTETPLPVVEPTATPVPVEPTATEPPTAEPVPTEEPTHEPTQPPAAPAPAAEPPPTDPPPAEPAPPAKPGVGAHGVIGKLEFREGRNTYGVGEKVFVRISATNTNDRGIQFGILGLNTSDGGFQTSWDNDKIDPNATFRHEDGVPFGAPGNHKIWLSICFSTKDVCQSPDGDWERFEPGVDVIVQ